MSVRWTPDRPQERRTIPGGWFRRCQSPDIEESGLWGEGSSVARAVFALGVTTPPRVVSRRVFSKLHGAEFGLWNLASRKDERMTAWLVITALGLATWLFYTWLTRNAVIAGIWMSATLILAGLMASVRFLVS